jgi:NAD(P)-dependent dehydrogenase (short-subunit alcohol dehydrogenase family)
VESKGVALVTGSSRGIGRAVALALAQAARFDIVVHYVNNQDAADEVNRLVLAAGRRAHVVQADIAKPADRKRLVDEALLAFGRIDLLVNNAGIAPDKRIDLLEASEESFDRVIEVNLKAPYFLTQRVAKHMIEARSDVARLSKIVTISSVSAYAASVNRGEYCVAKAGLAMMTKLFASRLAEHGINVYEIRPGIIETDMTSRVKEKYDEMIFEQDLTPIARWGQVEDVAAAVVAIASGAFPFSTGEAINVDGGFHLRRL